MLVKEVIRPENACSSRFHRFQSADETGRILEVAASVREKYGELPGQNRDAPTGVGVNAKRGTRLCTAKFEEQARTSEMFSAAVPVLKSCHDPSAPVGMTRKGAGRALRLRSG